MSTKYLNIQQMQTAIVPAGAAASGHLTIATLLKQTTIPPPENKPFTCDLQAKILYISSNVCYFTCALCDKTIQPAPDGYYTPADIATTLALMQSTDSNFFAPLMIEQTKLRLLFLNDKHNMYFASN